MKSLVPWKWGAKESDPIRLDDWVYRWLDDPFESFFLPAAKNSASSRLPSVDVSEDKKEITVKAEIPGMSEKDIDLTWHNGVLTIRGEKKAEKEEKDKNRFYRECSYGNFTRNVALGANVDWQKAKAKYKNGVLTVTLPKTESAQRAVTIKIN